MIRAEEGFPNGARELAGLPSQTAVEHHPEMFNLIVRKLRRATGQTLARDLFFFFSAALNRKTATERESISYFLPGFSGATYVFHWTPWCRFPVSSFLQTVQPFPLDDSGALRTDRLP